MIEHSSVLKAEDMIAYTAGSVVSKSFLKKPGGTVTLFAFDKGEGLSEHTAPFDALVYLLDGTANITLGEKSFTLNTGQLVLMPAGVPHSLLAVERFKMMLVMIKS